MIDQIIPDEEVDLLGFDGMFPGKAGITWHHFPLVEAARIPIARAMPEPPPCPYISPDEPSQLLQPNGISGPRRMVPVFAKRVINLISSLQPTPEKREFPTNPLFLQKIDHCSTVHGELCIIRHGREIGTTEMEVLEGVTYFPWNESHKRSSATDVSYATP